MCSQKCFSSCCFLLTRAEYDECGALSLEIAQFDFILGGGILQYRKPNKEASATYYVGSREDDGQAESRDDDARREEDGQLFAGVAGRVCVVDHPPRDAVRDGREDVEEEEEQRPVFAAGTER